MIVLGLTGSIGMGKSTAAGMLESLGVPCHDSDVAVHRLMAVGGKAYEAVAKAFPGVAAQGGIDRKALGRIVFADAAARERLEGILHPLVRESQKEFVKKHEGLGAKAVVLDIPLLFETGAEANLDKVICVHAPYEVQRQRVLARPGMTDEKFEAILASQMPSSEKCARADYVVETGAGMADTMRQIKDIVSEVLGDA
jgi:dephospho-CoA kinase